MHSIEEMLSAMNELGTIANIEITYKRGSSILTTNLELIMDENQVYKTGLYVKDSINGVGTLTFIDPNTKIYGALGHEIIEKTTGQKLEIKNGKIYSSVVTGITPSNEGNPGEKNARYDTNNSCINVTNVMGCPYFFISLFQKFVPYCIIRLKYSRFKTLIRRKNNNDFARNA